MSHATPTITAVATLLIFFTVQQLGVLAFDISEHLSIIVPPKAEEEVQEA